MVLDPLAPVAQLDRALASGAKGRAFESHRARQILGAPPAVLVTNNETEFARVPNLETRNWLVGTG